MTWTWTWKNGSGSPLTGPDPQTYGFGPVQTQVHEGQDRTPDNLDVACWRCLTALSDAGDVAVAVDVDDNSVQCYQKDQKNITLCARMVTRQGLPLGSVRKRLPWDADWLSFSTSVKCCDDFHWGRPWFRKWVTLEMPTSDLSHTSQLAW